MVVSAQSQQKYSKEFTDGSRVYLKEQVIRELRSRLRETNPDIPDNELFQNKEWRIHNYTLMLVGANSSREVILWEYNRSYKLESKNLIPHLGKIHVNDIFLEKDFAYILYTNDGDELVISTVKKDDDGWYEFLNTPLAKSYEFQPILKAGFLNSKTPTVFAEYNSSDQKKRTWKWILNGNVWKKVGK